MMREPLLGTVCLFTWLIGAAEAADDRPLLYIPFDGTADAAFAQGEPRQLAADATRSFEAGVRGEAVYLNSDCRFARPGNFQVAEGTIAVWIKPTWSTRRVPDDAGPHYLFCLYGSPELEHSWAVNRWSLYASQGELSFVIFTQTEGITHRLTVPIGDTPPSPGGEGKSGAWQPGEWHHVAATWRNVNSGRADAEMHLYVDGVEGASALTGVRIDVGEVGDYLDLGRDSDASPDYAEADLDDFYLYGRAWTAEEIRRAVAQVRAGEAAARPQSVVAGQPRPDWWNDGWPFRAFVRIPPAEPDPPLSPPSPRGEDRQDVFVQLPVDFQADVTALGLTAGVDLNSLRVVECDPQTGQVRGDAPVPHRLADNRLEWVAPGETRAFHVYFRTFDYDFTLPLLARRGPTSPPPPALDAPAPDYATLSYGDAWDFDEGDFEGIDQWGNRPEFVRNRTVENGILSVDVAEDPWFIWGNMWGQVAQTERPVRLDLAKFPVLEMKVRQSVGWAEWELYGRPGTSDNLLHYRFPVTGTGWQRLRIDLLREARWRGVLTAFRIDPTRDVEAHVEIDWVRLSAVTQVTRGPVQYLGQPSGMPAQVALRLENDRPQVGSAQTLRVSVTTADGQPVARQPVTVRLRPGSGGSLEADATQRSLALSAKERRGLTDETGVLAMRYVVNRKAGEAADEIEAQADFANVRSTSVRVTALAGPPHHYVVTPTKATPLPADQLPFSLTAQISDEFDNPLPVAGRKLRWIAPDGATVTTNAAATDEAGKAPARLTADLARRWVLRVAVEDEAGLRGASAPLALLPTEPKPNPVRLLPNGYFATADGKPFIPLGGFYANWVGLPEGGEEGRRLVSFTDATEEQIVHWLSFLHEQGVTALRFMLRTHRPNGMEPMDVGGRVNRDLFAAVLRYLDLARPFGIRFLLVIHEDYAKPMYYNLDPLLNFCLPQFAGEDLDALPPFQRRFLRDRKLLFDIGEKYTDPDVIACQDQYTRELIGMLKHNPQVFGYELENEMVNCPADWANHALATIREVDPVTPICVSHGGGGLQTADPLWWRRNTSIDFYTYHLYPHGTTSEEVDYGAAVDVLTRYGRLCGVTFLGESSGDQFSDYPDDAGRRWIMRDIIWLSLLSGDPGCFFWNARGYEVAEFKLANEIMSGLDWTTWERAKPEIGIAVPHPLEDDKWFRTEAGRAALALMGRYAQHYLSQGVDFDFALDPAGYAPFADLTAFAPPEPHHRPFTVSPGFQLKYLARADWSEALIYVRNFGGVRRWETKPPDRWQQYLRVRRAAPLEIGCHLPHRVRATITDLDTHEQQTRNLAPGETLRLGETEHDWVAVLRPIRP